MGRKPRQQADASAEDASQGVSVVTDISINRKLKALEKSAAAGQRNLLAQHDKLQEGHVAAEKAVTNAVQTSLKEAALIHDRAAAEIGADTKALGEDQAARAQVVDAQILKALHGCEAVRAAAVKHTAQLRSTVGRAA